MVLINLDPTIGSEIRKTRPFVIIFPNEMKIFENNCHCTSNNEVKKNPTRVSVEHNNKKGMIVIDQIRTVDKKRIIKTLDNLSKSEIKKCKGIIKETFVD